MACNESGVSPKPKRLKQEIEVSNKRTLVAGGAGFIGSHLCARLLEAGHEVLCVDNFYTGRRSIVQQLLRHKNFELLRHDICFPLYVEVDEIYNLASPASPIHYQHDPVQTTKTNVIGSINLLGLAKRLKVPILLTSTSEIYGDPEEHPQKESYWGRVNPIGPRACYDEAKRCAETLFFDYRRQHDMNIKVVRIFNTYGPNMCLNDGRVVSNFIIQALRGESLTIHGSGDQTRSFCYVDDIVSGLMRMMNTSSDITGPVNLGNPEEVRIGDLANMILEKIDSHSKIAFLDAQIDDPKRRRPDISLAGKLLDWAPSVPLQIGLDRCIKYFRAELEQGSS